MTAFRLFALTAVCASLISCESTKKGGASNDPYASNYGNDGHYNPYPGQSGYTTPTTPSYQTPPLPAEPQPLADPYAFNSTKKPASSTASTSSGTKASAPKKTTASSTSTKKKPSSTSSSTKKKTSSGSRYTVSKGDTLYGIARKKGTTVAKIKAANGISGDVIRPGQALKIP